MTPQSYAFGYFPRNPLGYLRMSPSSQETAEQLHFDAGAGRFNNGRGGES